MEGFKIKVAILYIGIGEYSIYFDEFFRSSQKFFLKKFEKDYFVFSDKVDFYNSPKVFSIFQEDLGWPNNTLFRFEMFRKIKNRLKNYDYIYFFNANTKFCSEIEEDEILPKKEENYLVGLSWHIYDGKHKAELGYERRKKSKAYISYREGNKYFQGGLNGGRRQEYLELIEECNINIKIDKENHITAKSNDESHINKYFIKYPPKILGTEYGCPEEWKEYVNNAKIIFRKKEYALTEEYIKKLKKTTGVLFLLKKIFNKTQRMVIKMIFVKLRIGSK